MEKEQKEIKEINNFNENKLMVVKNDIVEAIYDLTVNQQKLFIALLSLINKNDIAFKEYKIEAKALMDVLNIKDENEIFVVVDRTTNGLVRQAVGIRDNEKQEFEKYPLFSVIKYKKGVLTAGFNDKMSPFLLFIKEKYVNFTKFYLKEIKPLQSKYSIRIYMLLKQYESLKTRIFDLEELRLMLNIETNKLKNFKDFRRFVIEPAQRELENTQMAFTWEPIREHHKFTKIKFTLKNPPGKEEITYQPEEIEKNNIVSDNIVRNGINKEEERKKYIEVMVGKIKSSFYNEYMETIPEEEKKNLYDRFFQQAKAEYPDEKEIVLNFYAKQLITDYIIEKNEFLQNKLKVETEKIIQEANKKFGY